MSEGWGFARAADLARTLDPEKREHQLVNLGGIASQVEHR